MVLYYITDRSYFADQGAFLNKIADAARSGVDYIQLREKDLPGRDLESLARRVLREIQRQKSKTRLLINSRPDVAIAIGADGVHLRSQDIAPHDARKIWRQPQRLSGGADNAIREERPASIQHPAPIIGVSCHTVAEVERASADGASFAVFGPVFAKANMRPVGLNALRQACQQTVPVLALGGITLENAQSCMEAGAVGIAGISLFQKNKIAEVLATLA